MKKANHRNAQLGVAVAVALGVASALGVARRCPSSSRAVAVAFLAFAAALLGGFTTGGVLTGLAGVDARGCRRSV